MAGLVALLAADAARRRLTTVVVGSDQVGGAPMSGRPTVLEALQGQRMQDVLGRLGNKVWEALAWLGMGRRRGRE